jgi:hypothetical protein
MSVRTRDIRVIQTDQTDTTLELSIRYNDGQSPFGSHNVRGYYLQVSYIQTEDGWRKMLLGRGSSHLLETATRFGQKRFDQLCFEQGAPEAEPARSLIQRVLDKNGRHLQVDEPTGCATEG